MSGLAIANDDVASPPIARVAWTGTPAAYDILASDPLKNSRYGTAEGKPCRRIVVGIAGTLIYTGLDGQSVTLPSTINMAVWDIQAVSLSASSTAQNVVVFW